jgi:hypothetical protein
MQIALNALSALERELLLRAKLLNVFTCSARDMGGKSAWKYVNCIAHDTIRNVGAARERFNERPCVGYPGTEDIPRALV